MYIIARKCQNSIEPRKTYLCVSVYDCTLHVNNKLIMIKTSIIIAILTQKEFLLPIKHKHYIGILRLISRMYTGLKNIYFTFLLHNGQKISSNPRKVYSNCKSNGNSHSVFSGDFLTFSDRVSTISLFSLMMDLLESGILNIQ